MQQTPEIESFISRIAALPSGPGVSLDAALQPALDNEVELRKLFATDRQNTRLANPHVGLVDIFNAPDAIRTTRARVVEGKEDLNAQYVMPLAEENRRKEGEPCMVADLEEFKKNWSIFTEGSLSQLVDWNNVVAAGGSILACLSPLDEEDKTSKRAIRKYYHSNAYPTSDVDLFLWGMTPEQAEAKIKTIYEAVRDSVPWDVTCIRTKHTVSIHSQYPYRSVQIVLRLYQSPAEILAGFDIDAPCCAYDGDRVWANPRAIVAMMRQCNTVDVTRRSPSYEIRLAKYSQRAFEVYVPTLKRAEVDPTIFERSIARMEGLARLLVLEKLADDGMRTAFLQGRRNLRGRPDTNNGHYRRNKRKYKGDLKAETGMGIEMNDYDVASLHIPYGPGWDARRIDKLVYQTDLGMNSTFNPKNKGRRLHRHPAFFGTIDECLEDCCENCPQPIDDDEVALQKEEDEIYISGRIKFIEENPGRQSITGSFNPIDVGEWSDQVYIKPTQQLFTAIAAHNRATVQKLLQEGIEVNQRDFVGRTTLHVAIFAKAADIACDLIDGGARISARLADGRAPLHLAAQYDQVTVIKKLVEQNAKNIAEAKKNELDGEDDDEKMDTKDATGRPSSEDDWSSHDDEDVVMSDADADDEGSDEGNSDDDDANPGKPKKAGDPASSQEKAEDACEIPEEDDQPDIIDIDALDWDFGFSAVAYAVLYASLPTFNALVEAGADPKLPTKHTTFNLPLHPLTLTILREDEDEACKVAERLLQLPSVSSSTANDQMRTIFHSAVTAGRTKLVETMLRCDPHASAAINFPAVQYQNVTFPVVTAISKRHFGVLGVMLAYGAKLELAEEDVTNALDAATPEVKRQASSYGAVKNYLHLAYQPLEVSMRQGDDIAKLLIALGATTDFGLKRVLNPYSNVTERRTLKDWVDFAVLQLADKIAWKKAEANVAASMDTATGAKSEDEAKPAVKSGWQTFYEQYYDTLTVSEADAAKTAEEAKEKATQQRKEELQRLADLKAFLVEIQTTLTAHNAKTWKEVYPSVESEAVATTKSEDHKKMILQPSKVKVEEQYSYVYLTKSYQRQNVPQHLTERYDELYEACYAGDNDKIQRLCLPIEGQSAIVALGVPLPLNISVRMVDRSMSLYDQNGYTPLFAAISGRRWSTAKLILAIATAQYEPEDDSDQIEFKVDVDMDDDDGSDNDSCASDDSEITVERQQIKFVDIATRPSAVKSEVHPKKMLEGTNVRWCKPFSSTLVGPQQGYANPLRKAVVDNDLEAFVHIANLYQSLPQPLELGSDLLPVIMEQDQPDILDEYIRRTGAGVDVDGARKVAGLKEGEGELPVATNDENKMYLGLNVHGKKRMDLAKKNDPNATYDDGDSAVHPLVWQAALGKAKSIITYLASDRPLAAYKFYASTHSDAKAIWFRRMLGVKGSGKTESDLEKQLSLWLGWIISPLGESPLTAAILGNDVDIVKLLAKLQPNLIAQALQTKIKFVGVNPLTLAVRKQCDIKIIDYLLSRKVSATERTLNDGWNIYHQICELNNGDLLEHLLRKLPKDVNEVLLTQQSKTRLNTPLHVAVKKSAIRPVKILLEHNRSTLLVRDVDGQTPLHCSVKSSYTEITKQLLAASPPQAIYMENCVGITPLETAALAELRNRLHLYNTSPDNYYSGSEEIIPSSPDILGNPVSLYLANADKIVEMLDVLKDSQGKYKAKVMAAITKWATDREKKLQVLKKRDQKAKEEAEERKKKEEPPAKPVNPTDTADVRTVWTLLQEACKAHATSAEHRQLIHLFEVQQSVGATLASVRGEEAKEEYYANPSHNRYRSRRQMRRRHQVEGELEEEEDEDRKERRMSMVFPYLRNGADTH
ncbi:hypothetical protein BDZ97DRAFT_1705185 [Flammula alnicola]|nr:hypothetical protein BDZ97DRAFT_1705185 [Flammula alnicola]